MPYLDHSTDYSELPLFKNFKEADLRNKAYREIEKLGEKQRLVLYVINQIQPCTDEQIAKNLGWEINRVTGRRHELVEAGLVIPDKKIVNEIGRTVRTWSALEF